MLTGDSIRKAGQIASACKWYLPPLPKHATLAPATNWRVVSRACRATRAEYNSLLVWE